MNHLGTSCVESEESHSVVRDIMGLLCEQRKEEPSHLFREMRTEDEKGLNNYINEWPQTVTAMNNQK